MDTSKSKLKRGRVVVIEDRSSAREALARLFRSLNFEVELLTTVAETVQRLDAGPACILLDLALPDGSGVSILRRIRAEHLPVRVAVITGITDAALLAKVDALAPDALFLKPANPFEVLAWVQSQQIAPSI
jgi:DNA-binding response OmpR family regulator